MMASNSKVDSEIENNMKNSINSKILVVFDLNGTLLTRIGRNRLFKSDLLFGSVCLRPHSPQLAKFLNSNVDYAFWTTQSEHKANESVKALYEIGFTKPKFFWKGDKCVKGYIKDLDIVADEFKEYNPRNIIIVDDSDHKIIHKDQFILVSGFNIYKCDHDSELITLTNYLKKMLQYTYQNDIDCIEFMKTHKYTWQPL